MSIGRDLAHLANEAKAMAYAQHELMERLEASYISDAEGFILNDPTINASFQRCVTSLAEACEALVCYSESMQKKREEFINALSNLRDVFRGMMDPDPKS